MIYFDMNRSDAAAVHDRSKAPSNAARVDE